jgi:hypothetical protein
LKSIGKGSNPPFGGLLGLIGLRKKRECKDRGCYGSDTDKNRKQ